jgi:hypothetical protein
MTGQSRSVALATVLLVAGAARASFAPGAVCDGVDLNGASHDLLRGKHLVVLEFEFAPWAIRDAETPYGWRGFDIDLLDAVAALLGFTFEVRQEALQPGEDYSSMLMRTLGHGDLWLSWWSRSVERMNRTVMLNGHIDTSPNLVIPPPSIHSSSSNFGRSFTTFFNPFSPALWVCIVALLIVSGCVDYLLEAKKGGSLSSSLYEYFGGVLFGGFTEPMSRASAVYQILVAFIILIVVSAVRTHHTKSLAASASLRNHMRCAACNKHVSGPPILLPPLLYVCPFPAITCTSLLTQVTHRGCSTLPTSPQ